MFSISNVIKAIWQYFPYSGRFSSNSNISQTEGSVRFACTGNKKVKPLFIIPRSAVLCKAERKVKQENHRECYLPRVFIRNSESGSEGEMFTGLFYTDKDDQRFRLL